MGCTNPKPKKPAAAIDSNQKPLDAAPQDEAKISKITAEEYYCNYLEHKKEEMICGKI